MFKVGMVAFAFLISASSAMAQDQPVSDSAKNADILPPWNGPKIDGTGWYVLGTSSDNNVMAFGAVAKPIRSGPYRRVWFRTENAIGVVASTFLLEELDCQSGKFRSLQQTNYSAHNGTGQSAQSDAPSDWSYPIPGSFGETLMNIVCQVPDPKS